jgi:hypothetical protein
MTTMIFERVSLVELPCHTLHTARMQAVKVVMDSDVAEKIRDAAAELDTVVSMIVDEALCDRLARWKLAAADARWQEREREIEAFFADGGEAAS